MIRFPKMHIAESAVNRIMNAIEGVESAGVTRPLMPESSPAGAELDRRLSNAPRGAAPDAAVIEGAATGEVPPLQAVIEG